MDIGVVVLLVVGGIGLFIFSLGLVNLWAIASAWVSAVFVKKVKTGRALVVSPRFGGKPKVLLAGRHYRFWPWYVVKYSVTSPMKVQVNAFIVKTADGKHIIPNIVAQISLKRSLPREESDYNKYIESIKLLLAGIVRQQFGEVNFSELHLGMSISEANMQSLRDCANPYGNLYEVHIPEVLIDYSSGGQ